MVITTHDLRLRRPEPHRIRIVDHEPRHQADFKCINVAWIARSFAGYAGNTQGCTSFLDCLKAFVEHGINLRKGAF